jgi:hypothetical protein
MASLAAPAPTAPSHSLKDTRMEAESESEVIEVEDDDDDDQNGSDAAIDEEQLEEYKEMVEQLGSFPVRQRKATGGDACFGFVFRSPPYSSW